MPSKAPSCFLLTAYMMIGPKSIGLKRIFLMARGARKDRLQPCIQPNPQTAPRPKRAKFGTAEQCVGLRAYGRGGLRSASVDIHFLIMGMLGLLRQMVGRSAPTAATIIPVAKAASRGRV